jgi:hypothetical protein
MTKYGSADVAFLLFGGRDIKGFMTTVNLTREAKIEETTGLGVADETHAKVGVNMARLTQSGFFDDAAGASNEALVGLAETVAAIGLAGNVIGRAFIGMDGAIQATYDRNPSKDELHKAAAAMTMDGAVEEGVILHELSAETSDPGDTESDSVDNAASSANGGAGYLEVTALALGGYTSVQVTIRDSADDISFADHSDGAFAVVTVTNTAERIPLTGTIRRYAAIDWDFIGSGSSQSITFMVGLVRA